MTNDNKLISFDLRSDFCFFKKPDVNDGILLSYNSLHKPALLGILGAIIGLRGYERKGQLPEYYQCLKGLPIGIEPIGEAFKRGGGQKCTLKYSNTIGYANQDGNMLIEEVMLVKPAFRCYLLIDNLNERHIQLYNNLEQGKAEFIPYLGKNEFQAWWLDENGKSTFQEYRFDKAEKLSDNSEIITFYAADLKSEEFTIDIEGSNKSVFSEGISTLAFASGSPWAYFENLPTSFDEQLLQYNLSSFVFTNIFVRPTRTIRNLYYLKDIGKYVQLL